MSTYITDFAGTWQFTVCSIVVQIATLVFFSWLLGKLWKREPQQLHFVWKATVIATILVCPLRYCVPNWKLELANDVKTATSGILNPVAMDAEYSKAIDLPARHEVTAVEDQLSAALGNVDEERAAPEFTSPPAEVASAPAEIMPTYFKLQLKSILLAAYAIVLLVLTCRILFAYRRLVKKCNGPRLPDQFASMISRIATRVGLKRPPRVVINPSVLSPMVLGMRNPTVILPTSFLSWGPEMQESVLAHEFCHLKRRDVAWNLIAIVAQSVYWFHPAVAYARHQMLKQRELATDQHVLQMGFDRVVYAEALLQIASDIRRANNVSNRSSAFAVQMAGTAELGNRIHSVLDDGIKRQRSTLASWSACFFTCCTLLAIAGFSIQVAFASPEQDKVRSNVPESNVEKTVDSNSTVLEVSDDKWVPQDNFFDAVVNTDLEQENQYLTPSSKRVKVFGKILNVDGSPAANAIVAIRNAEALTASGSRINGLLAKTKTNVLGGFEFESVQIEGEYVRPQVFATSKSGNIAWKTLYARNGLPAETEVNLELEPAVKIRGKLIDDDGIPVAGAELTFIALRRRRASGQGVESLNFGYRFISPTVISRGDGSFEFPALPRKGASKIYVRHVNFPVNSLYISDDKQVIKDVKNWGQLSGEVFKNGSEITLDSGVEVIGEVSDHAGQRIAGAWVQFFHQKPVPVDAVTGEFRLRISNKSIASFRKRNVDAQFSVFNDNVSSHHQVSVDQILKGKLNLKVSEMSEVVGTVVSDDGKPLEKIGVKILSSFRESYNLETDAQGEFRRKLVPGDFTLKTVGQLPGYQWVSDDDSTTRKFTLTSGKLTKLEPIVVERLGAINVTVLDINKRPVSGAQVSIFSPDKSHNHRKNSQSVSTGQKGTAMISADSKPQVGTIASVRFEDEGKVYFGNALVDLAKLTATVELHPAATATGKVTLNGKPLENVVLEPSYSIPNHIIPGIHPQRALEIKFDQAATNADGKFTMLIPSLDIAGNPTSITASVRSGIPNRESSWIGHRFDFDGTSYVRDIEFVQGDEEISGTVTDETGEPVAGLAVYVAEHVVPRGPKFVALRHRLYLPATVYTDVDGKFSIRGLPKGIECLIRTGSRVNNIKQETDELLTHAGATNLKLSVRRMSGKKKE